MFRMPIASALNQLAHPLLRVLAPCAPEWRRRGPGKAEGYPARGGFDPGSLRKRSGFGLNEVIGIAAGIIIAVVIVIPGLQTFANNVLTQLTTWWNGMAADIFQN